MELEFNGQYEKSAYFKAIQWIYKPSKRVSIIRIGAFILFLVLYVAYLVTAFSQEGVSAFELSRVFRYLFTFLILAYFLLQPYIRAYLSASRLWADPITRRKISGRISGIGIQFLPSDDWMPWDQFVKVHKSIDMVVLLTATWSFVILPRQFFQSDKDWEILLGMISSKVKEMIS